jgi:2-keto-3-deoxy-L-fuconate dehydrogenase
MALTKQVAVSYAGKGIRCNAMCPGPIETPILTPYFARPGVRQEFLKGIPLGRLGKPEDVANLALFLASDESSFITGALIVIDGGITAA